MHTDDPRYQKYIHERMVGSTKNIMDAFISDERKTELIWEYLTEAHHNGWDGWEDKQFMSAADLLADIHLYIINA